MRIPAPLALVNLPALSGHGPARLDAPAVLQYHAHEMHSFEEIIGKVEYRLGQVLVSRGWRMAVAESCTGGLLSARLTDVPGSSRYFLGGVVSYSNELKRDMLGVPEAMLQEAGAVSEPAAAAMARGLEGTGAELRIAVTGVAGPGGGTKVNPVGSTWIAVAVRNEMHTVHRQWDGDRTDNRRSSVQAALELALHILSGEDHIDGT